MNMPTPPQLNECPELGVLSLLEFALDLAARELVAAHPQLDADEVPYWILEPSPSGYAARLILPKLGELRDSLDEYRRVAEREHGAPGLGDIRC